MAIGNFNTVIFHENLKTIFHPKEIDPDFLFLMGQATAIIVVQPLAMFSVWKRALAPFDPGRVDSDQFYAAYLDLILKGLRS